MKTVLSSKQLRAVPGQQHIFSAGQYFLFGAATDPQILYRKYFNITYPVRGNIMSWQRVSGTHQKAPSRRSSNKLSAIDGFAPRVRLICTDGCTYIWRPDDLNLRPSKDDGSTCRNPHDNTPILIHFQLEHFGRLAEINSGLDNIGIVLIPMKLATIMTVITNLKNAGLSDQSKKIFCLFYYFYADSTVECVPDSCAFPMCIPVQVGYCVCTDFLDPLRASC